MKKNFLVVAAVLVAAVASPAMAGHRHMVYSRPVVVRHYSRPVFIAPRPVVVVRPMPVYRSWFAPAPVYVAPAPIMVQAPPVVYTTPVPVVAARPIMVQLQFPPGFQETGRRYHGSGSNAGTIDWVKGVMPDGRRVEIEFNHDGTVREIEND